MKKSFLVMAAVFVSALVINSNPLMAQTKTDQELAKENLELRRQNAELRDRLRRLERGTALLHLVTPISLSNNLQ